MSTDADEFAQWDAAYVLGALSPEDRREFEGHLAGCPACQQSVAEVAGLPGLLTQISLEDAAIWSEAQTAEPSSLPPGTLLPQLISRVRSRRRRVITAVVGVAAGLGLLLGGMGIGLAAQGLPDPSDSERLAFSVVNPSSLTAVVDVSSVAGGTELQVECQYGEAGQVLPGREYPEYSIVVVDRSDRSSRLKDWHARPSKVMHPQASTPLKRSQIKRIEIRRADTDETLLQTTLR